jgi:hypothetical protein
MGVRGHFVTKSSSYSTNLGELRATNPGEVLLAAGVEASLRAAREELLDLRRAPP